MLSIEITSDLASMMADSQLWNPLARGVPFRETGWLGPWWTHFGVDSSAYLVVARDESGTVRGILPLYRTASPSSGRGLAFMADGEACSDYVSVLARPEDLVEVSTQMGQHLAFVSGCPQLGWDTLDIDGVVEGDAGMAALASGLEMGGATIHASSRMSVWYKPADADWEAHLKHYGKTQRRKMRRWSEKIGDSAPFQQRTASSKEQVSEFIQRLIEMHQQRWNDVGETGSFANPTFRQFILDAAMSFLTSGKLYLSALEHDGQVIAAELGFVGRNRILYTYSAGFDTSCAELEPGRVLGVGTLQHVYRESLAGIDYMRGDEEYKKRCTTESRRLLRMRAVAPALLPRLRHAAWCTGFEFKQWVRRQTGRPLIAVVDSLGGPPNLPASQTP